MTTSSDAKGLPPAVQRVYDAMTRQFQQRGARDRAKQTNEFRRSLEKGGHNGTALLGEMSELEAGRG